jgi:dihydrofolate reductase/uncharacterized protein YndB with AHSA1/START domain
VESFTVSIDGYGAGPDQSLDHPLGVGGTALHQWAVPTRTMQKNVFGAEGGTTGLDDDYAARGFENIGAWILGRNMFGPVRGPWPNLDWKGWWGDNPPYHVPIFVVTHHARPPLEMEGHNVFHFVTGGIHETLERARAAAMGKDVRIGGGPNIIQQCLRAGLVDQMHVAISPVVLGSGERLFEGVDLKALGYECVEQRATEKATHVVLRRKDREGSTFRTHRVLPHPPERVFEAFARPETLARWWGPNGFTNTFEVFEFRQGGRWTFEMHGPEGTTHRNRSRFLALDAPSTIVIQHESPPHYVLTISLAPHAEGTTIGWNQAFEDPAVAARIKHIVVPSNEQNLDRLASALSGATL